MSDEDPKVPGAGADGSPSPVPASAPPSPERDVAVEEAEGADAPAYQAAGRVSPWGYVFLAGVAMLVMGFVWWKVEGESGPVVVGWMFIAFLLTLAPIAWHAVDFFQAVTGRRGLAGAMVAVTLALGVVVYGLVSAVNVKFRERVPSVDLTGSGKFTLGDESEKILASVGQGTVYVTYLEHNGPQVDPNLRSEVQEQLRVYARTSSSVKLRVFDAFRERDLADRYLATVGVTATTSGEDVDVIVLSYAEPGREVASGKQKEIRVEDFTFAKASGLDRQPKWLGERVLTGAIQELVFQRYKVYVTGGHGERSLATEFRAVREALASRNLEVMDRAIDLATEGRVPEDCDLLLVLGPSAPFTPEETKAVEAWLARGRSLFLMLDIEPSGRRETGLESLLEGFGITPHVNYVVIAPTRKSVNLGGRDVGDVVEMSVALLPGVTEYAEHPAVRAIRPGAGFRTHFFESSWVEVLDEPPPGVSVEPVVYAPELAGATAEIPRPFAARLEPGRREYRVADPSRDKTGARLPLVVAASRDPQGEATAGVRDARVVVSGDTHAFSDAVTRDNAPNLDLFNGLVQWSLRREELVSISERTLDMDLVDLDERKRRMAIWLPLASTTTALLAGAAVWWARRR